MYSDNNLDKKHGQNTVKLRSRTLRKLLYVFHEKFE